MTLEQAFPRHEVMDEYQLAKLDAHIERTREVLAMEIPPEGWRDVLDTAADFLTWTREAQEQMWYEIILSLKMCGMALNNQS